MNLSSEIIIKAELRPCLVKNRKALFHRWSEKSEIVDPSPMIGGHSGGVQKYTVGIVEYDDGTVHEAWPHEVVFVYSKIRDFSFGGQDEKL